MAHRQALHSAAPPATSMAAAPPPAARVARLYRSSLKNMLSWAVDRTLFWEEVRGGGGAEAG